MLSTDINGTVDLEEENAQETMASLEEMLEGYEWASDSGLGNGKAKGTVDQIEARLLDELMALDKVSLMSLIITNLLTLRERQISTRLLNLTTELVLC